VDEEMPLATTMHDGMLCISANLLFGPGRFGPELLAGPSGLFLGLDSARVLEEHEVNHQAGKPDEADHACFSDCFEHHLPPRNS